MRVTQTISIGTLRINSMSNTSIVQIGTSGSMKSRSENINEYITQPQADRRLEGKITKELKKQMSPEGLPVESPQAAAPQTGVQNGTWGVDDPFAPMYGEGPDVKTERKNRT